MISKITSSIIILVFSIFTLSAQSICPFVAGNANFLSLKSDYEMNSYNKSILPSYSIGMLYNSSPKNNLYFKIILDYSSIRSSYPPTQFATLVGTYRSEIDTKINNHYVFTSGIGMIRVKESFHIGAGLSAGVLLHSVLITKETEAEETSGYGTKHLWEKQKVSTDFYKPITLLIPIVMSYEFNNFEAFLNIRFGITNKSKGETYIKEYDNIVQLGLAYSIWKKNSSTQ